MSKVDLICVTCRQNPKRKNDYYCRDCRNLYMRNYRKEQRRRAKIRKQNDK